MPFRVAEMPFFIAPALRESLDRTAVEIVGQLSRPELLAELKQGPSRTATARRGWTRSPAASRWTSPSPPRRAAVSRARWWSCRPFPSGYAMMLAFARLLEPGAAVGARTGGPLELLRAPRRAVAAAAGRHHPRRRAARVGGAGRLRARSTRRRGRTSSPPAQLFGVDAVCPTELVKEGRRLFRRGCRTGGASRCGASTTGWSSTSWRRSATGSPSPGRTTSTSPGAAIPTGTGPGARCRCPT